MRTRHSVRWWEGLKHTTPQLFLEICGRKRGFQDDTVKEVGKMTVSEVLSFHTLLCVYSKE